MAFKPMIRKENISNKLAKNGPKSFFLPVIGRITGRNRERVASHPERILGRGLRQEARAGPQEERAAHSPFDPLQLRGESRLRQAQGGGGLADAAGLGYRADGAEVAQLEVHLPTVELSFGWALPLPG